MPLKSINEPGVYTFDQLAPGSVNEPPVLPPGVFAPNITLLSPSSVVAGGSNFTLYLIGTGFFDKTVIFVNGGSRVTKLESDGRLSTAMRPSQWTPQTAKIQVRNGIYPSNIMDLVFTAAKED
jgi:hypothetical protein